MSARHELNGGESWSSTIGELAEYQERQRGRHNVKLRVAPGFVIFANGKAIEIGGQTIIQCRGGNPRCVICQDRA